MMMMPRWQKAKNPGDWRRGDLEEEVENAAKINDVDEDGDVDVDVDEDGDRRGHDGCNELTTARITVGANDRVTGTMHFFSLGLTSMIDNQR